MTRLYWILLIKLCLANAKHWLNKFMVVLDLEKNIFMAYIAFFYIKKLLLSPLNISILLKFLSNFIIKLLKLININNQIIYLIKSKKILYNLVYNLRLIELKTLKTYVEINLANKFIESFKL